MAASLPRDAPSTPAPAPARPSLPRAHRRADAAAGIDDADRDARSRTPGQKRLRDPGPAPLRRLVRGASRPDADADRDGDGDGNGDSDGPDPHANASGGSGYDDDYYDDSDGYGSGGSSNGGGGGGGGEGGGSRGGSGGGRVRGVADHRQASRPPPRQRQRTTTTRDDEGNGSSPDDHPLAVAVGGDRSGGAGTADGDEGYEREQEEAMRSLQPLRESLTRHTMSGEPPSLEELRGRLALLERLWDVEGGAADDAAWLRVARLNLGLPARGPVDAFGVLREGEKAIYATQVLFLRLASVGLAGLDTDESRRVNARVQRLVEKQYHAAEALYSLSRVRDWATGGGGATGDPGTQTALGMFRFVPRAQLARTTPYQRTAIFLLRELHRRGWRRYGEDVYQPIVTPEGHHTNAWSRVRSIEEFVQSAISSETHADVFMDSIANGAGVRESVTRLLKKLVDPQFMPLRRCRRRTAWRDGVYDVEAMRFWTYDEIRELGLAFPEACCVYHDMPFRDMSRLLAVERVDPRTGASRTVVDWRRIPTPHYDSVMRHQKFPDAVRHWDYVFKGRGLYRVNEHDSWEVSVMYIGRAGTGKSTTLKPLQQLFPLEDLGILSNNSERQWALWTLHDKYVVLCYEVKEDFALDQGEFQSATSGEPLSIARKNLIALVRPWEPHIFMCANEMMQRWRDTGDSLARRIVMFWFRVAVRANRSNPHLSRGIFAELPLLVQKFNLAYREYAEQHGHESVWHVLPKYFRDLRDRNMKTMHPLIAFIEQCPHLRFVAPPVDAAAAAADTPVALPGAGDDFAGDGGDDDAAAALPDDDAFYCRFAHFKSLFQQHCRQNGGPRAFPWNDPHHWETIFEEHFLRVRRDRRYWQTRHDVPDEWVLGVKIDMDGMRPDDDPQRRPGPAGAPPPGPGARPPLPGGGGGVATASGPGGYSRWDTGGPAAGP